MSDNNEIRILQQFKSSLITFVDELISQLAQEPDLVIARIFLNDQVPIKDVMDWFVHQLVTVRGQIKNRDEQYFISNTSLFTRISPGRVNNFKRIWRSGHLDDETREVVWKWIDSFVYLADKYSNAIQSSA